MTLLDFSKISYLSLEYFVLVGVSLLIYYIIGSLPGRIRKFQWLVLLVSSTVFYYLVIDREIRVFLLFIGTIIISYLGALILSSTSGVIRKVLFIFVAVIAIAPLMIVKCGVLIRPFFPKDLLTITNFIIPVGLSFYSLQVYGYLYDVYKKKITPEKNILRYFLFVSFFPHIVQGPIARYESLSKELFCCPQYDERKVVRGFQLIIWGFFLKYMIAERAALFVDAVFDHYKAYLGLFVLIAGILYSLQLYTDFLSCVCISLGIAEMFGIVLTQNFERPYLSTSIRDFWRRWHISLSSWLRDYVYIPLGGNRKGVIWKYVNLMTTFLISGIWHGNGYRYVAWGALHGVYQLGGGGIAGGLIGDIKKSIGIKTGSTLERCVDRLVTFLLVMIAWIIFRADKLRVGLSMVGSIFTVYNPWILFDDSLLRLGLDWKDWIVLIASILLLFKVEELQERGQVIRDRILDQPIWFRWGTYLACIGVVIVFGIYGFGFDAKAFIYGSF